MRRQQKQHIQHFKRRGIAAMEFAVCIPILLVLIIGTIEACSMIYLKQTLVTAAYEGVRASVLLDSTASDVTDACNRILTSRNTKGATVTISPANFETQPAQTWITVRVSAGGGDNSVVAGWFYDQLTIAGEATMMKEYE